MDRMNGKVLYQLAELAESFSEIGLTPVICGGLGIYLSFHKSTEETIRATNDIDLMLTRTQLLEQSQCNAIAEIITDKLNYIVCDEAKHFRFRKDPNQQLDILAPPVKELKSQDDRVRVKIVSSKLHGRFTEEACFIEEDLKTVFLSDIMQDDKKVNSLKVMVPSPANILILKLFAFDDRSKKQQDLMRAQAHARDIFITIMLTDRSDYLEGQKFLSQHSDSEIIQRTQSIVANKFSAVNQAGWQCVLEASDFYPNLNRQEKESKLDTAAHRLARWFNLPLLNSL